MKQKLKDFREIFWPILELDKTPKKEKLPHKSGQIKIHDETLDSVLAYAMKVYEFELNRSTTVESKSSLFIGTLSVVSTIILAITTVLINSSTFSLMLFLIVFTLFILTIYLVRTIWFSVKVLERKTFQAFHYNDFMIVNDKKDSAKHIIAQLLNKIDGNVVVINSKVDNMTMAQEYFKRAIVVLAIYSGMILFSFTKKYYGNLSQVKQQLVMFLNNIYFSSFIIVLWLIIIIISLGLNIYLLRKLKNKPTNV